MYIIKLFYGILWNNVLKINKIVILKNGNSLEYLFTNPKDPINIGLKQTQNTAHLLNSVFVLKSDELICDSLLDSIITFFAFPG